MGDHAAEGIGSIEKPKDTGNQTSNFPAYSIMLQPTMLPCAPTATSVHL